MIFQYENFSKEIDNTDVELVKKYEECLDEFYKRASSINMKGKTSDIYFEICSAGRTLIDGVLGDGAAQKMFGERQSVRETISAVTILHKVMTDVGDVIESMKKIEIK